MILDVHWYEKLHQKKSAVYLDVSGGQKNVSKHAKI